MQLSQYAESLYVKIDCPYCTVEAVGVHKKIKKHHNAPGYLGRRICRFSIYENGLHSYIRTAVLWIRIRIGSAFRNFVDPGSAHVNIG